MGQLKVHGGDFLKSSGQFSWGSFSFYVQGEGIFPKSVQIPASELEFVEVATEESARKSGEKSAGDWRERHYWDRLGYWQEFLVAATKRKLRL
jgi:hypothetical protein